MKPNSIVNEINTENMMRHVKYLSNYDRESGSKGEWIAADYFKEYMQSIGLEAEIKSIKNLISLPGNACLKWKNQEIHCITHSYSAPTPTNGISGSCVYIEDINKESNCDLSGKIVITRGLASPLNCYRLEKTGAIALVFINGGQYEHNMSISPIWGMPLPEDLDKLCKIPVISVTKRNGEVLLSSIGKDNEVYIRTEVDTSFRQVPLCIADLYANSKTDKYVLFNGHIDSWHKGATDNGTSNAAILEIARVLKQNVEELNLNVRFIWWSGHSNGRYSGSNWYADYNWEDIHRNAVININIDAIGSVGSTEYPYIESSSQCFQIGANAVTAITGQRPGYSRIQRNGDQSFWAHGVPSLFQTLSLQPVDNQGDTFVPGLPWFWHTTEDKYQYVDEKVLCTDAKIYLLAIWNIVTSNVVPFCLEALANEMIRDLDVYQKKTDKIDLTPLLDEVAILKKMFIEIDKSIKTINLDDQCTFSRSEALLEKCMNINRIIMPVYYCSSSPFEVDNALPTCPFPSLKCIEKIDSAENELMREGYLRKSQRAINKIYHAFVNCKNIL